MTVTATGPLAGVRIIEFGAIGPVPFAAMMLSDMGAEVLTIERKGARDPEPANVTSRGRTTIALDLKQADDVNACHALAEKADIVLEGNRPGVMERLGLGPDALLARNPRLVYGRMTGWGQEGPFAQRAGHDINFIAVTGALHAIGPEHAPVAPLNLVGDYGGGAMFLVSGVLAALLHSRATGTGQVVDAAMTDGVAYLMAPFYGALASGKWIDRRQSNSLDGGAPFYNTYRCADGEYISVGPLEPQFYAILLELSGAAPMLPQDQNDRSAWSAMRETLRDVFAKKTRDEWCAILQDSDACFAPVLSLAEAPSHPHNVARTTFVESGGVVQPTPAPRFTATPSAIQWPPAPIKRDAAAILASWSNRTS